jgi:hypothetical protein
MARFKFQFVNLFFVLMIYFWALIGLVMVTEFKSSAAEETTSVVVPDERPARPIAPRRDITDQRLAPLSIDSRLPPFWSR